MLQSHNAFSHIKVFLSNLLKNQNHNLNMHYGCKYAIHWFIHSLSVLKTCLILC